MLGFVAGAVLVAYLSLCLMLRAWQNRFIFFPTATITQTPSDFGARYEEVRLSLPDDAPGQLYGWWLPATAPARGTILYCHGNGSNISGNLGAALRFVSLGFNVFLFDYRGYGLSTSGFPTEAQVYEDAGAALDYLLQTRQIAPQTIILYGHSLGGAVAIELAARHPQLGGLIVEASFTSMQEMVAFQRIYALFPVSLLLSQRFDSIHKLRPLSIPILLIHGTSDRTVPYTMSQALFEVAPEPKKLLLVPDAGHNNVAEVAPQQYLQAIDEFAQHLQSEQQSLSR
ncbi:alpha/beta hydrolase [Oscillatoria sp. FACHB-1406]|uniref:alpha/beta hydrolase n=1 Tax=Oscillatoria sp. FACHB-1406 TaxID=2692846 RepID=UPI001685E057|nr:alpha/beta hydrolase [Oscillatoria sp. FACHB-1406]MBD2580007.1 alpha/beta hydrolase [Oscillatoria sp. FACHB-1406]